MSTPDPINDRFLSGLVGCMCLSVASFGITLAWENEMGSLHTTYFLWDEHQKNLYVPLLTSIGVGGIMIGTFTANLLVGYGRRRTILIAQCVALAGALLNYFLNIWALVAARFIYGVATGLTIVAVSLYFSETIPASRTGRYGFAINFGIVTGITIMLCLGLVKPGQEADKHTVTVALSLFNLVPIVLCCLVMILWLAVFRSESTDYCIKNQDKDNHGAQLNKMVRSVYMINESEQAEKIIAERRQEICSSNVGQPQDTPGTLTVMTDQRYMGATWICILMALINQLDGVNVMNFYSNEIFKNVFGAENPSATVYGSVMVGVAQLLGVLFAPLVGSKMGMKRIFVVGQIVQCVLFGLSSLFSYLDQQIALVVCILLFLFVFQAGFGSFFFAYVGEVCQEKAVSLAQFSLYVAIISISQSTEPLFNAFGTAETFAIFCIINLLGGLFIALCSKEITGLSKKELERLYMPENYKRSLIAMNDSENGQGSPYKRVHSEEKLGSRQADASTGPSSLMPSAYSDY